MIEKVESGASLDRKLGCWIKATPEKLNVVRGCPTAAVINSNIMYAICMDDS
jgi:hypothetical protein